MGELILSASQLLKRLSICEQVCFFKFGEVIILRFRYN